MATTTLGVKLDDATRDRLKQAAQSIDRTPHWLIKQAIFNYLEQIEGGLTPAEHSGLAAVAGDEVRTDMTVRCSGVSQQSTAALHIRSQSECKLAAES